MSNKCTDLALSGKVVVIQIEDIAILFNFKSFENVKLSFEK